ncbi:dynactin subunit 4, putative [Eimeria necatrix]|uniref:Dynactin subunit 4 n=1 Tax=Eimeria necatrix TaxID=51315 RepID=U6MRV9_9EIME|nr:dynactin subunit 4, putative [Eimeria necatrix]CDJ65194.1 dynactin subunit 4, putative [Eimeria necatrix]
MKSKELARKTTSSADGTRADAPTSGEAQADAGEAWADISFVPPVNFLEVLRKLRRAEQDLIWSANSYSTGCSSVNDVYILLNADLDYRRRVCTLQQQREGSFFSDPQLFDAAVPEQQEVLQELRRVEAELATAAPEPRPGCLYRLEELYVCEPCGRVLSPLQVAEEVECYFCPGCLELLPVAEGAACGFRCSKCFSCPRCMNGLSLSRKKKDEAELGRLGLAAGSSPRMAYPFTYNDERDEDLSLVSRRHAAAAEEAEAAAEAAAAVDYAPLLDFAAAAKAAAAKAAAAAAEGRRIVAAMCEGDPTAAQGRVDEVGGFAVPGAPQRCDSLLSVPSLDGDTDEAEAPTSPDALEGDESDSAIAAAAGSRVGPYCSRQHVYFYCCNHCSWSSEISGVSSCLPAALPVFGAQGDRAGMATFAFGEVLDVLQQNACETERRRQLQQTVKSRAVAALIAAAASSNPRDAKRRSAAGTAAAAGHWKVSDADGAEAERDKQLRNIDIWSYRRPPSWSFAPPRASLAAVAAGQHLHCSVKETLALAAAARQQLTGGGTAEQIGAAVTVGEPTKAGEADDAGSVSSVSTTSWCKCLYPSFSQPLHAEQLLVDRGHPDVSTVYSGGRVVAAARGLCMQERVGLQQLLQCPDSLAAAAAGCLFLPLKRRLLLQRRSKRCNSCGRFVVKAGLALEGVPPFRVNKAANLYLPTVQCCVGGTQLYLSEGRTACVYLSLSSAADSPVIVRLSSAIVSCRRRILLQQRLQQLRQQLQKLQQLQDEEEEDEEQDECWWTVDWNGDLSVQLAAYDEVLDELEGAGGAGEGVLQDVDPLETRDAVLMQSDHTALLRLEVQVHPNSNDRLGLLPLAAEVKLGTGLEAPTFQMIIVAALGPIRGYGDSLAFKRTESI